VVASDAIVVIQRFTSLEGPDNVKPAQLVIYAPATNMTIVRDASWCLTRWPVITIHQKSQKRHEMVASTMLRRSRYIPVSQRVVILQIVLKIRLRTDSLHFIKPE
jgi:hypothetical protein